MKDEEGYLYDDSHVAPSKPHSPMAMGRAGGEGKVKIQNTTRVRTNSRFRRLLRDI
jgi:hypothetical protein